MPEWLWGVLIGVIVVGLIGVIWHAHERHNQERINAIWDQIGRDSESGMRRTVHASASEVLGNRGEIREIKERLDKLEGRQRK